MDEDDMTFDQLRAAMLAGRPAEVSPRRAPSISTSSKLVIESTTLTVFVSADSASYGSSPVLARGSTRPWSAPGSLRVS
jgi:hypothetical protein